MGGQGLKMVERPVDVQGKAGECEARLDELVYLIHDIDDSLLDALTCD